MPKRLTKRYIVTNISTLNLSEPLRYERYYINDNLRIQKKENLFEKETLDDNNVVMLKEEIDISEFENLKKNAYKEIIRDSYLYLDDERVSIKRYYGLYEGLIRVEVKFETDDEMNEFQKLKWMGKEITESALAFDKYLSKLDKEQFLKELNKFL